MLQAAANLPDLNQKENVGSGHDTPGVRSRAPSVVSSPAAGTRAPPPTPAAHALTTQTATTLEAIEEDHTDVLAQLADQSDLRLKDSKYALKVALHYPVAEFKAATLPLSLFNQNRSPERSRLSSSTITPKIKKDLPIADVPRGYVDDVVSKFRRAHLHDSKKEFKAPKQS